MERLTDKDACFHCNESKLTKGGFCASNGHFVCEDCSHDYCFICCLSDREVEIAPQAWICHECHALSKADEY